MIQRIKVHRQDCLLHSDKVNCYLHEYFPHWNICQVLLELRGTCKWKFRSWKCPDFQGSTILLSADLCFWKAGFYTSTDSCICCHPGFDKATICLAEITELRLASNYVYIHIYHLCISSHTGYSPSYNEERVQKKAKGQLWHCGIGLKKKH